MGEEESRDRERTDPELVLKLAVGTLHHPSMSV